MTHRLRLHADLTFALQESSTEPAATMLRGTVTGDGPHLDVTLDDLAAVRAGIPGGTRRTVVRSGRAVAAMVAGQGFTLTLRDRQGPLVTVGAVRAPVLTRLLTRSAHLRVDDWSRALRLVRTRRRDSGTGLADLLPPGTPWPPVPMFRIRRRTARTTHDPLGGGRPRLVFSVGRAPVVGVARRVYYLPKGSSTIGSDPRCDLTLPGLAPRHADVVRRVEDDEYLLVPIASDHGGTTVNGQPADGQVLRTGSRIQLGEWTMSYSREEYADHGRPYGGRAGGEFSRQVPQPRPAYRR